MQNLIQELRTISKPVIQNYHSDLENDIKNIDGKSQFYWAARTNGTYFGKKEISIYNLFRWINNISCISSSDWVLCWNANNVEQKRYFFDGKKLIPVSKEQLLNRRSKEYQRAKHTIKKDNNFKFSYDMLSDIANLSFIRNHKCNFDMIYINKDIRKNCYLWSKEHNETLSFNFEYLRYFKLYLNTDLY